MKLQLELREELGNISSFNSMTHDASTKHLGTVELCFTESHLESNEPGVTEVKRPKCDSELSCSIFRSIWSSGLLCPFE